MSQCSITMFVPSVVCGSVVNASAISLAVVFGGGGRPEEDAAPAVYGSRRRWRLHRRGVDLHMRRDAARREASLSWLFQNPRVYRLPWIGGWLIFWLVRAPIMWHPVQSTENSDPEELAFDGLRLLQR